MVRDVDLERRDAGDRPCRARGSRPGSSGRVARSLPNAALTSVKRSPVSCMPSPESPAKRMTTRRAPQASGRSCPRSLALALVARPAASLRPRHQHEVRFGACSGTRGGLTRARRARPRLVEVRRRGPRGRPRSRERPRPRPRARRPWAVRKNRRRTTPTTTTSSPASRSSTHAGGSQTRTGTDVAWTPGPRVRTAREATRRPDVRRRISGGVEQTPRRTARFTVGRRLQLRA